MLPYPLETTWHKNRDAWCANDVITTVIAMMQYFIARVAGSGANQFYLFCRQFRDGVSSFTAFASLSPFSFSTTFSSTPLSELLPAKHGSDRYQPNTTKSRFVSWDTIIRADTSLDGVQHVEE